MDWLKKKEEILQIINRYKFIAMLLVTGIFLLTIPEKDNQPEHTQEIQIQQSSDLQYELQSILSLIHGAGKVAVLLTEKRGEEIIYQMDENITVSGNGDTSNQKTLIITDENRIEKGLIRQVNPPQLQGAVVVCQGADDPKVKLAIVDAVMHATGLPSSKICVVRMK